MTTYNYLENFKYFQLFDIHTDMDDQFTFDNSSSMYSFFEDLDGEDSGMEDLPFSNYVELEGIIEKTEAKKDNCMEILGTGTVFDQEEDELAFIDDDKDEDYKPRKASSISKKVRHCSVYQANTFLLTTVLFTRQTPFC